MTDETKPEAEDREPTKEEMQKRNAADVEILAYDHMPLELRKKKDTGKSS